MSDEVDNFLAHYGVKGMRWGKVKNDDTSSDSSKAETTLANNKQKAKKYYDRAADSKRLISEMDSLGIQSPEMRRLYGRAVDQSDRMFYLATGQTKSKVISEERSRLVRREAIATKDAAAKEQGKLSRGQKIAIGGAAVGAGLLLAYGIYKYPDIVTRNAEAGSAISVNNFMKRYSKRAQEFGTTPLTKAAFDKLSDNDVNVKAGTVFKRITAYPDEDLSKRLYTTFTDADNDKYAGLYGPMLKMRTGAKTLYVSEMKMGESISSPSHKKRVQALIDILKENAPIDDGEGEIRTSREWLAQMGGLFSPISIVDSSENLALKHYNTFAREIVGSNPLGGAYLDKIKSQGYNALIDDNDASQLSDLPLILLDAAKTTSSRTATALTSDMEKAARKRLVEVLG